MKKETGRSDRKAELKITAVAIIVSTLMGVAFTITLFGETKHTFEIFVCLCFCFGLSLLLFVKLVAEVIAFEHDAEYLSNKFKRK